MRIQLATVMVDDQQKALKFYTEILGFVEKREIPMGESTWVTVVSPEGPQSLELILQPVGFLPAKLYQKSLFDAGSSAIAFASDDIEAECRRLKELGVTFRDEPVSAQAMTSVLFEDTCGNLVTLYRATDAPI